MGAFSNISNHKPRIVHVIVLMLLVISSYSCNKPHLVQRRKHKFDDYTEASNGMPFLISPSTWFAVFNIPDLPEVAEICELDNPDVNSEKYSMHERLRRSHTCWKNGFSLSSLRWCVIPDNMYDIALSKVGEEAEATAVCLGVEGALGRFARYFTLVKNSDSSSLSTKTKIVLSAGLIELGNYKESVRLSHEVLNTDNITLSASEKILIYFILSRAKFELNDREAAINYIIEGMSVTRDPKVQLPVEVWELVWYMSESCIRLSRRFTDTPITCIL